MERFFHHSGTLHHKLFKNVLESFTEEETNRRLDGHQKNKSCEIHCRHLLNSQYGLSTIAGIDPVIKWNELFRVMGQSQARDNFSYPHIDEIKAEWNGLHEPARAGLINLSPDDLAKNPPSPFDKISNSMGELWAFINHHQAYHIGQIGILRRGFGKEPMSYQ